LVLKLQREYGMIESYAEYGAIGVIVLLFIGMIHFLKTTIFSKLQEIKDINIKLIDRWNRSDEIRDRRHEDIIKELNNVTDDINYLKGKINGRN
jgi:cell division protein FtsL|tara:strand:- start:3450 stop:3731 length:282 start_codon:yes stop_codon:yes gene_type:complete